MMLKKIVYSIVLVVLLGQFGLAQAAVYNLDGDGYINWVDIDAFTEQWLDDCLVNDCGGANFNSDNTVDFGDLALLAQYWLQDYYVNTYYVASDGNDSNDGSFEHPFATVQKGVNVLQPGDCLYLRAGTYSEHVSIPHYKQGDDEHWFTVKSYPGEWAVIDPCHDSACPVIGYGMGGACGGHIDGSYDRCPQYWIFERFEVTGGGIDNVNPGGGIRLDTAANITFRYLYVHDNYGDTSSNNGGIVIPNDSGGGFNIKVQWCHLKDNACNDGGNCANITLFSDYVEDPCNVDINRALRKNEISYNLIEGSAVGVRHKNGQFLSLDHSGTHTTYNDYGDKIHHNIIRNQGLRPLQARQDFVQIYNNIFASDSGTKEVTVGSEYSGDREKFYACFYNNTLIKTRFSLCRDFDDTGDGSSYDLTQYPDYHPHFYCYNNIIENVGPESDNHNDLNVLFTYGDRWVESEIAMDTVHIEDNYFWPRTRTENIINLAGPLNDYSADGYESAGHSTTIYANQTPGLHKTGSGYKTDGSHVLDDSNTIADGGIDGPHPYLSGITIPSYLGAADPDNDDWVDDVWELINLSRGPIPPEAASAPSPSNSDTGVIASADLSWTAGPGAVSCDVYFGTTSPGTFQGNQGATTFDPGTMATGTSYYWRIDGINAHGTTLGEVWSFTTTNQETVGETSVFGSTTTTQNRRAMPYTMPEDGTIDSVAMYHIGGSGNMLLGVYTGESLPDARIAVTVETAVSGTTGWQTIDLTSPVFVSSGTKIWLAWVYENNPGIAYATGTPGRASSPDTWPGGMPDPFGSSSTDAYIYSIYANYIPAE